MTGRLPFSHESFLDVFGAYNADWWPLEAGLWLLSAAALALLAAGRPASRSVAAILALHWLACGALYHLGYFRAINPAAAWFGLAFLLQAALFLGLGVMRPRLVVPILWCALAGSAALTLGVWPDLMLLPAGGALLVRFLAPRRPEPRQAS
jgi:hypothetical protein